MKAAIGWMRANLVVTASAVVGLLSLGLLIVVHVRGNAFIQQMEQRQTHLQQMDRMSRTSVRIPAQQIDQLPQVQQIAVNQIAIDSLRRVYNDMHEQYSGIFQLAVQQNQARHYPMLDGLLPDPGQDQYKLYDARRRYLAAFDEMLQPYSPNALYPRLNAKRRPLETTISDEMHRIEEEFLNEFIPRKAINELTVAESRQLRQRKEQRWLEMLVAHAESAHIYAETRRSDPAFPFQVGEWSRSADRPELWEIWEGQLELWIQQDIVEVIQRTNRVEDPGFNVIAAPIKRLLNIELVNGYVGINSPGGLSTSNMGLGPPISGEIKLPDDFSKSPTGRRSNTIYDVRHVWVEFVIDAQRLPEFFDNLIRVNFMTVLKMELTNVDEYAALREGYVYGSGDAVQVRALIETIWLRDWTRKYMPKDVQALLGITDGQNT